MSQSQGSGAGMSSNRDTPVWLQGFPDFTAP